MNRMEFEAAIPKMAAQFVEQGYSMTTLGTFLQFCRSISRRLPESGPEPNVAQTAEAYVDALEKRARRNSVDGQSVNRLTLVSPVEGPSVASVTDLACWSSAIVVTRSD